MRTSRILAKLILVTAVLTSCSSTGGLEEPKDIGDPSPPGGDNSLGIEDGYLPVSERTISGAIPVLEETGGSIIPLLAADWIDLKGGQILPPPIVTWPRVESDQIDLSINSPATPLLVELYKFSAIDPKGVPDEDAMEYESCELATSSSEDGRNSGCTYRRAIDGKVHITVYSAPKYLVLGSTWYPDLGDDETSSEANVTASWAITTE